MYIVSCVTADLRGGWLYHLQFVRWLIKAVINTTYVSSNGRSTVIQTAARSWFSITVIKVIYYEILYFCKSFPRRGWAIRSTTIHFRQLQVTQNALARVVCQAARTCSATELRRRPTLHWLSVKQRIDYKLAVLTNRARQSGSPSYLTFSLQWLCAISFTEIVGKTAA